MRYGRSTVVATLEELGVNYSESYGTPWAEASCPLHDDESPSFTVHLDEGGWRCYSGCGSSGDLAYLVSAVTGEDASTVRRRLLRGLASTENIVARIAEQPTRVTVVSLDAPDVEELEYERGRVPKYFFRRGFTKETARAWEVGWDKDLEAVVIPVYQDGVLRGLVRRKLKGTPKYLNSPGLSKSDVLLGLDHLPFGVDEVILVEGPMDVMWLYQHGYPAVATLGASLSVAQADTIKRLFWRVIIAYDDDKAGRAAATRAQSLLRPLDVRVLTLPLGRHDIQECTAEELAEAFGTK